MPPCRRLATLPVGARRGGKAGQLSPNSAKPSWRPHCLPPAVYPHRGHCSESRNPFSNNSFIVFRNNKRCFSISDYASPRPDATSDDNAMR